MEEPGVSMIPCNFSLFYNYLNSFIKKSQSQKFIYKALLKDIKCLPKRSQFKTRDPVKPRLDQHNHKICSHTVFETRFKNRKCFGLPNMVRQNQKQGRRWFLTLCKKQPKVNAQHI